jgi:hypothetical protein
MAHGDPPRRARLAAPANLIPAARIAVREESMHRYTLPAFRCFVTILRTLSVRPFCTVRRTLSNVETSRTSALLTCGAAAGLVRRLRDRQARCGFERGIRITHSLVRRADNHVRRSRACGTGGALFRSGAARACIISGRFRGGFESFRTKTDDRDLAEAALVIHAPNTGALFPRNALMPSFPSEDAACWMIA